MGPWPRPKRCRLPREAHVSNRTGEKGGQAAAAGETASIRGELDQSFSGDSFIPDSESFHKTCTIHEY